MRPTLLLASGNPNKLRELRRALPGWEIELLTQEEPVEDGETFLENARIKARHGRLHVAPDEWVAGEDSGIEVAALGGRPGIESARWASDPVERLLTELAGVEDRSARYVCELVVLAPDGSEVRGMGTLDGTVALEPRGSEGFGYDPVFVPLGEAETVAALGDAWKSEHSHRARAAAALAAALARRSSAESASVGAVEAAKALAELTELSSQIGHAVVLRADGSVLASTDDDSTAEALGRSALELVAAAFELRSAPSEVTRIEVELAEGGLFVLCEGGRTIAATTGPEPTAGLVVYDLRTCLGSIDETKPKRQRKPRESDA